MNHCQLGSSVHNQHYPEAELTVFLGKHVFLIFWWWWNSLEFFLANYIKLQWPHYIMYIYMCWCVCNYIFFAYLMSIYLYIYIYVYCIYHTSWYFNQCSSFLVVLFEAIDAQPNPNSYNPLNRSDLMSDGSIFVPPGSVDFVSTSPAPHLAVKLDLLGVGLMGPTTLCNANKWRCLEQGCDNDS